MVALRILFDNPIGLALAGASRVFYPRNGSQWVEVNHIPLRLPRLSPKFHGYRLVQISDFHLGTWLNYNDLRHAVELVNDQNPDLVVITGDFVTINSQKYYSDLVAALGILHATDGVVAVLGNHDHWSDSTEIIRTLNQINIKILCNDVFTLKRGKEQLHICGIDDMLVGRDHLDQVLLMLPEDGAAILLAHEPDFADISAATRRFDLQLSGHSHGGQIVLPWIGIPFLPSYASKYVSGLYRVKDMYQYTNRGLGTSELQIRVNCPPEISVFTLEAVKLPKHDSS